MSCQPMTHTPTGSNPTQQLSWLMCHGLKSPSEATLKLNKKLFSADRLTGFERADWDYLFILLEKNTFCFHSHPIYTGLQ